MQLNNACSLITSVVTIITRAKACLRQSEARRPLGLGKPKETKLKEAKLRSSSEKTL
jgi:hypothetical protein